MQTQDFSPELECVVAGAVARLAAELRLVDLGDYIAYMRMDRWSCIAEIVREAAELFFMPGFVEFDMDGDATIEWGASQEVTLMLVLKGSRTNARVSLKLCEDHAEVKLGYVDVADAFQNAGDRGDLLANDIADNALARRGKRIAINREGPAAMRHIPSN